MDSPGQGPAGDALCSTYGDDPEMVEIVELFVVELPERVGALRQAFEQGDEDAMRTLSHQLKGAAPGYGFPLIGEHAGRIEALLRGGEVPQNTLREQLNDLVALCERARVV